MRRLLCCLLLLGCEADIPDGAYICRDGAEVIECPPGFVCVGDLCVRGEPSDAGTDTVRDVQLDVSADSPTDSPFDGSCDGCVVGSTCYSIGEVTSEGCTGVCAAEGFFDDAIDATHAYASFFQGMARLRQRCPFPACLSSSAARTDSS